MENFWEKVNNFLKTGKTTESVNKTCHDPARDMVDCVSQTKCFQEGRALKDCTQNDSETGAKCKKQLTEWYLCRKFSVDHTKHWVKDTYK